MSDLTPHFNKFAETAFRQLKSELTEADVIGAVKALRYITSFIDVSATFSEDNTLCSQYLSCLLLPFMDLVIADPTFNTIAKHLYEQDPK